MRISELCHELDRVKNRFGDLDVRTQGAPITQLAVLPAEAIDEVESSGKLVVVMLTRGGDSANGSPTTSF